MNKTLALAIILAAAFSTPARASESECSLPDSNLAKYVIDHLDVRSFVSSIAQRRQADKSTFADYGFVPEQISQTKATLESKNKDWRFEIQVLKHDKASITLSVHDLAQNGGDFNVESILLLHQIDSGKRLVAAKDSWIAAGF